MLMLHYNDLKITLKVFVPFVIHTSSPHRVTLTLFSDLSKRVTSLLET